MIIKAIALLQGDRRDKTFKVSGLVGGNSYSITVTLQVSVMDNVLLSVMQNAIGTLSI